MVGSGLGSFEGMGVGDTTNEVEVIVTVRDDALVTTPELAKIEDNAEEITDDKDESAATTAAELVTPYKTTCTLNTVEDATYTFAVDVATDVTCDAIMEGLDVLELTATIDDTTDELETELRIEIIEVSCEAVSDVEDPETDTVNVT